MGTGRVGSTGAAWIRLARHGPFPGEIVFTFLPISSRLMDISGEPETANLKYIKTKRIFFEHIETDPCNVAKPPYGHCL